VLGDRRLVRSGRIGRVAVKRNKPRKPPKKLPPVPKYTPMPRGGTRYWRMGGPLTRDKEAEARASERAKPPGRMGRFLLRVLGGRTKPPQ
jgi:hypothetical protein